MKDNNISSKEEDGRKNRRSRNKKKVLDSFIELVDERTELPSTEEVASRAGVSRRSIFRYFSDIDQLVVAAYNYQIDLLQEKFPPPSPAKAGDDREKKITEYVEHLSSVYEFTASMREVFSEKGLPSDIRNKINEMRSNTLRNRLQEFFDIFLENNDDLKLESNRSQENFFFGLESFLSPEGWDYLRGPCGLSCERAKEVWKEHLQRIFKK